MKFLTALKAERSVTLLLAEPDSNTPAARKAEIKLDEAFQIADEEALPVVFDLLKEEGLCLGASSGINIAGAIRLARVLGPGHTIVTILADGGQRYHSKLFNPAFLKEKGLPAPDWL